MAGGGWRRVKAFYYAESPRAGALAVVEYRCLSACPSPLRGEGQGEGEKKMTDLSGFCSFMKRDNLPNRSLSRTLPRIMSVILNLFQDLVILFIRLSLFVKYMRC